RHRVRAGVGAAALRAPQFRVGIEDASTASAAHLTAGLVQGRQCDAECGAAFGAAREQHWGLRSPRILMPTAARGPTAGPRAHADGLATTNRNQPSRSVTSRISKRRA